MPNEDLPIEVGHFAIVKMSVGCDGEVLQAFRVAKVVPPNTHWDIYGYERMSVPYTLVHLEGAGFVSASTILRVLSNEAEAKIFNLEQALKQAKEALEQERAAHTATREGLKPIIKGLRELEKKYE